MTSSFSTQFCAWWREPQASRARARTGQTGRALADLQLQRRRRLAPPAFRSWADVSDRALYAVRQGADGARHLHRYCTKLAPSGRTSGVDAIRSSPQTLSTRRSPSVAAAPPTLMSKFPMISIAEANEKLKEMLRTASLTPEQMANELYPQDAE